MLLEMGCADILQPDVGWCGGITELLKISALADAHGKLVVPHGSSVYSYHFVITRHNSPFAEFLMMAPEADTVVPMFSPQLLDEPVPVNGRMKASALDAPGFGVRLTRSASCTPIHVWSWGPPITMPNSRAARVPHCCFTGGARDRHDVARRIVAEADASRLDVNVDRVADGPATGASHVSGSMRRSSRVAEAAASRTSPSASSVGTARHPRRPTQCKFPGTAYSV